MVILHTDSLVAHVILHRKYPGSVVEDIVTSVCDPLTSILFLIAPMFIIFLTWIASVVQQVNISYEYTSYCIFDSQDMTAPQILLKNQ